MLRSMKTMGTRPKDTSSGIQLQIGEDQLSKVSGDKLEALKAESRTSKQVLYYSYSP